MSDLDTLLTQRDRVNAELKKILSAATNPLGVEVGFVCPDLANYKRHIEYCCTEAPKTCRTRIEAPTVTKKLFYA